MDVSCRLLILRGMRFQHRLVSHFSSSPRALVWETHKLPNLFAGMRVGEHFFIKAAEFQTSPNVATRCLSFLLSASKTRLDENGVTWRVRFRLNRILELALRESSRASLRHTEYYQLVTIRLT